MTEATTEVSTQEVSTSEAPSQAISEQVNEQPSFKIPDEYKDKGWAQDIKSEGDFFKSYDNAQTLIGKRPAGIPTKEASDAEWETFYKAAGRPDEASYEFKTPESLGEDVDLTDFNTKASEVFHKAGLNPMQAQKVYDAYLSMEVDASSSQTEAQKAESEAKDAEFDGLLTEHFPDGYDDKLNAAVAVFDKHTPQSLKGSLDSIVKENPQALAGLVMAINGIQSDADSRVAALNAKYGGEGSLATGAQATPTNMADQVSEWAKLTVSPAAKDPTHADHKAITAKIAELNASINRK